jgi:DNA-binding GntR family transcriptional regulator
MSRAGDRAYAGIRTMIISGELPPGAPLREEHLADLCGVSRTPVRDALRRLEAELFVVRSESQRSLVADWSHQDVDEMFTLRGMLESHAAARAATRIRGNAIDRLQSLNAALLTAISQNMPDIPSFLDHNREFHRLVLDAAESPRLSATLATLIEQPVVRRTAFHYNQEQLARSAHEHSELIAAFEKRDADWARAVMHGHIRRAFHAFAETATPRAEIIEQSGETADVIDHVRA